MSKHVRRVVHCGPQRSADHCPQKTLNGTSGGVFRTAAAKECPAATNPAIADAIASNCQGDLASLRKASPVLVQGGYVFHPCGPSSVNKCVWKVCDNVLELRRVPSAPSLNWPPVVQPPNLSTFLSGPCKYDAEAMLHYVPDDPYIHMDFGNDYAGRQRRFVNCCFLLPVSRLAQECGQKKK